MIHQQTTNQSNSFSTSEDALLSAIIQSEPFRSWKEIALNFPGKSPKECRERWFNHLAPWINKGEWTNEEDELILQHVRLIGTKWDIIEKFLPGRTGKEIKNRYNSHLSKKSQQDLDFFNDINLM